VIEILSNRVQLHASGLYSRNLGLILTFPHPHFFSPMSIFKTPVVKTVNYCTTAKVVLCYLEDKLFYHLLSPVRGQVHRFLGLNHLNWQHQYLSVGGATIIIEQGILRCNSVQDQYKPKYLTCLLYPEEYGVFCS
jgi:hypothetical protein